MLLMVGTVKFHNFIICSEFLEVEVTGIYSSKRPPLKMP